ncbi:cupin-like domain-containing protein [Photorhabdus khanii]|nr:cupin-like domain-containing protein [Photorhabdus khanii]
MSKVLQQNGEIARIDIKDIEAKAFFRQYRKAGYPVIITGAFDGVSEWSVEYLAPWLQGNEYRVREFGENRNITKHSWTAYSQLYEMKFEDYVDALNSGEASLNDIYMSQVVLDKEHGLFDSIGSNIKLLSNACGLTKRMWQNINCHLWLGPIGHIEPLHSDEGDSTLCQLYGSKKVTLFPSRHHKNLYPFPFFSQMEPWVCRVDIDEPDFAMYPRAAEAMAEKVELILNEKEILFIPAQWCHQVSIIDKAYACSVSIMWDIPFARNFISRRTLVWYLLRITPGRFKNWIYDGYYRIAEFLK